MSNNSIGFIGGGRITRIFLEGWKRANALPAIPENQTVKRNVKRELKPRT